MASEVATLEHEIGNHAVETRASVAESVLASRELTEVASGLGNNIVVQLEHDAARGLVVDGDVELKTRRELVGKKRVKTANTDVDVGHGEGQR